MEDILVLLLFLHYGIHVDVLIFRKGKKNHGFESIDVI